MIRIYFLFLFLFFVSCSVDNEEDYFALNCVTEDIYYISVDLSRSVSNIISNKCLNCHAIDNMELSGSWLPLETHEQLITIDFDEHVFLAFHEQKEDTEYFFRSSSRKVITFPTSHAI